MVAPPPAADAQEAAEEEASGELVLDEDGRVKVRGAKALDYGYRTFDGVATGAFLEALRRDCGAAFGARMKKGGEAYSAGSTYWVPAGADREALSAIERAALDVFDLHSAGAAFDAAKSGAEWWTLAMEPEEGNVAWHFDRDYSLEGDVNLSPHVATVTYLASAGAATVVVPLVAPSDATLPVMGRGGECFASKPVAGKHMSFDGRFLHAAPDGLFPADDDDQAKGGKRVTLLVNVWLDWKPSDADVLPEILRAKLGRGPSPRLDFATERRLRALPVDSASKKPRSWAFKAGDHPTRITLRAGTLDTDAPDAVVLFQAAPPDGPPLVAVVPKKPK